MASLTELNQLAEKTYGYIKFKDLVQEKPYKVLKFDVFVRSNNFSSSAANTKSGNRVCAHLDEGYVVLPQRFDGLLEDDRFEKIDIKNLYVVYHGHGDGNRVNVTFETIDVDGIDEPVKV